MTDDTKNGEGDDFPLTDPGPEPDEIIGLNIEELFEIGMGNQECADDRVRREAQTFVATTMRAQGYTYQVIANELGCALSWAYRLVNRGLKRMHKKTEESAETIRQLQITRLDKMLAGVMDRAETGDSFAIQSALQIMDRIDKAWGLEPPKRVEHTFTDEAVNDARNQLAKALGALTPAEPDSGGTGEAPTRVN